MTKLDGADGVAKAAGRLKADAELKKLMARYYQGVFWAKRVRRPIAWITSGTPVEPLYAMGIVPVYPENYGAILGSRKVAAEFCEIAEGAGYSHDLCSYARGSIGSMMADRGPLGGRGLPAPDLLISTKNICNVVVKWWEVIARHYGKPLFVLDVPYVAEEPATPHQLAYVRGQLEEMIAFLERHTHRRLSMSRLVPVLKRSTETVALWERVQACRRASPSPASALDMFTNMFPIVTLRGTEDAVRYYRMLAEELDERVRRHEGPVPDERFRLVWDNIAIWHNFRLVKYFHERGAVFVGETYTNAWGAYEFSPEDYRDPLAAMARQYSSVLLNVGPAVRLARLVKMCRDYRADGVVFHSNRSCKTYSLSQYILARGIQEQLGRPTLFIEADMTDPRAYADAAVKTRVDAYLEILDGRRADDAGGVAGTGAGRASAAGGTV
ncbi:MAG TPA: 2-hydroxyacyl-CoA dehydratase family protein [Bacillota bacterium]|jgi:bcr-type benzoyl-CoA reductase subunit B